MKTTFLVRIPVRQLAYFEVEVEAKTASGAFKKALAMVNDKNNSDGEVVDGDDSNIKVAVKKESLEVFEGEQLRKNIPSSVEVSEL